MHAACSMPLFAATSMQQPSPTRMHTNKRQAMRLKMHGCVPNMSSYVPMDMSLRCPHMSQWIRPQHVLIVPTMWRTTGAAADKLDELGHRRHQEARPAQNRAHPGLACCVCTQLAHGVCIAPSRHTPSSTPRTHQERFRNTLGKHTRRQTLYTAYRRAGARQRWTQVYGFEIILMLERLEEVGLLKRADAPSGIAGVTGMSLSSGASHMSLICVHVPKCVGLYPDMSMMY